MNRDPMSDLTREVMTCQRRGCGKQALVSKIAGIVYRYPAKHYGWDEDDIGDFFCGFFPKIEGLIDRFTFGGKPFEAYLASSIRWQMKTFARKKAMYRAKEEAMRNEYRTGHPCVTEPEYGYWAPRAESTLSPDVAQALQIGPDFRIQDPARARRFVYLMLRNAAFVDDSLIEHTAELCGVDANLLLGHATELRQWLRKKIDRHRELAERRSSLHFRIQYLRTLLEDETEYDRRKKMQWQIDIAQERIEKTRRALSELSLLPTHKDIGEVLGVPKGSIDSGLYYMRRAFKEAELN